MPIARVQFVLLGPWHAGTGRGEGAGADALVNTDEAGLPFLPGRTVKGLLRDAAEIAVHAGALERAAWRAAFGHEGEDGHEEMRYRTVPGQLVFGSAHLGEDEADADAWRAWASQSPPPEGRAQLFRTVASTALDQGGSAAQSTLRTVQIAMPATLVATVGLAPDAALDRAAALAVLRAAAPHLYAIGAHRTRGLGRCVVRVQES